MNDHNNGLTSAESRRGVVFISFGSYLKKIDAIERAKPESERRSIPSLRELADATNSNRSTLSRLYRGDIVTFNIRLAGAIIREMRRRGFDMQITDLIDYIGPSVHMSQNAQEDGTGL